MEARAGISQFKVRLFTAFAAAFLFCPSIAGIHYARQSDVDPFSYLTYFMLYSAVITPIYVFIGLPCSVLIDMIIGDKVRLSRLPKYIFDVTLYAVIGALLWIIPVCLEHLIAGRAFGEVNIPPFYIIAFSVASLLYYHLVLLFNWLMDRQRNS
ncbi:hypothetical protein [Paenibacillus sp. 481]|uniref:hypothetical protein n=1 Tax=Paenibacillus sp. 481 TaxID=2835869 RepID=UPI001E297716|nr:hypothetical protein [Paenibacillus sp. 481]UHA73774.1 hypothetical protein KIK04_00960 [Paenibacillus sp. 481]